MDPVQEEARLRDPVFIDSDEEQEDLVEVSEKTSKFLHLKCTRSVTNETRKRVRTRYPLPKVPATRPPQLDTFLKQEVSMNTKNADKELAKVQALMLDSMAPLTYLLEADARGDSLTLEQVRDAAKTAVELSGNANARISRLRREKVCQDLNKALIPLAKDDGNFDNAPPALFGTEFAKKAKDHVDQVKALRSSTKDGRPFFRGAPPNSRGGYSYRTKGGRGGGSHNSYYHHHRGGGQSSWSHNSRRGGGQYQPKRQQGYQQRLDPGTKT